MGKFINQENNQSHTYKVRKSASKAHINIRSRYAPQSQSNRNVFRSRL